jgi:hypothetical protein
LFDYLFIYLLSIYLFNYLFIYLFYHAVQRQEKVNNEQDEIIRYLTNQNEELLKRLNDKEVLLKQLDKESTIGTYLEPLLCYYFYHQHHYYGGFSKCISLLNSGRIRNWSTNDTSGIRGGTTSVFDVGRRGMSVLGILRWLII